MGLQARAHWACNSVVNTGRTAVGALKSAAQKMTGSRKLLAAALFATAVSIAFALGPVYFVSLFVLAASAAGLTELMRSAQNQANPLARIPGAAPAPDAGKTPALAATPDLSQEFRLGTGKALAVRTLKLKSNAAAGPHAARYAKATWFAKEYT